MEDKNKKEIRRMGIFEIARLPDVIPNGDFKKDEVNMGEVSSFAREIGPFIFRCLEDKAFHDDVVLRMDLKAWIKKCDALNPQREELQPMERHGRLVERRWQEAIRI